MLKLDFINVGSGDAILIRETGGEKPFTMLVDAGDDRPLENEGGTRRVHAADYLAREGVEKLDLLVITHLHRDHLFGAEAIVKNIAVDKLIVNYLPDEAHKNAAVPMETADGPLPAGLIKGLERQMALANALRARGAVVEIVDHPVNEIPLTPALSMDVTCCGRYLYARYRDELDKLVSGRGDRFAMMLMRAYVNLTSLRIVLTYHGKRIFLPADAYAAYWEVDAEGPCHILKLPHHGCAASVTPELLDILRPEIAVVSVANNCGDRPDEGAVRLLLSRVPQVYFTDAVSVCGIEPQFHEAVTLTID